jgi:hypothetical protein
MPHIATSLYLMDNVVNTAKQTKTSLGVVYMFLLSGGGPVRGVDLTSASEKPSHGLRHSFVCFPVPGLSNKVQHP